MTFFKNLFLILISNPDKAFLEKEDLYVHLSDEELVKQIVADNDPMLFGKLYDRYVKMVYNKCYGFAKSADEAEDLTQDVFLQLFIKLRTFKGKSKFSTWLYSFTYNFCVNYVNRNKQLKIRDKSVQVESSEYKLTEEVPDESLFEMKADKLKKCLEIISAEERSILLLKYQDGASIKELVNLLDIGESAVKMRLKRAKERLLEIYNTLE
ncbi:MAG TPA: RNA polymerase subunit sigma-70 [Muricauda sp.]|uniref:RNA polymerase sigma factor n=1 Tax=Flagellimonas aurea TaxID=2915619 RepID=UPI000C3C8D4B|nr:RNA polymerase sigma factor [Allomuricauda aurea]MAO16360.1 RNA polymerase subunit sigma-70 [Allomuricauda sp.]MAO16452.1 RNA polymerase subunit sigma-70 [Allomuricauda sp.]MBC71895.1 RNA polymerase subunit sigma-70 [Allomuricauda sp.]HBU77305.1 RNA polymerase subunit sigma-70 [Allomuricauda sp.]